MRDNSIALDPSDHLYFRSVLQVLNGWDPAGVKPNLSGRPMFYQACAMDLVENLLSSREETSVREILEGYMVRSFGFSEHEITEQMTAPVVIKLFNLPY